MGWVSKAIMVFLSDVIYGLMDLIGEYINNIFATIVEINNIDVINQAFLFTTTLSIGLVVLLGISKGINIYIMQTEGDAEADPMDLIVRCSQAIAVIACSSWIYTELNKIATMVTSDLIGSVSYKGFDTNATNLLSAILETNNQSAFVWVILLFAIVIAVILFCLQAGIRGSELMLGKIMLPFMAVDLVTEKRERWNNFFTTYMVTIFGYAVQLLCFKVFITLFAKVAISDVIFIFACLGWLILMLKAPKWLEKFIYNSGVGGALKGAGRNALYVLPHFIK